jgi:dipeptidyl aminopeptidase/acylaminoacyl peptidase
VSLREVVSRSLDQSFEPRVSPDGKTVAFIRLTSSAGPMSRPEEGATRLYVLPTSGSGSARVVADFVGRFPDWSSDGQYVVFARAATWPDGDQLELGTISRRQVCDTQGFVLEEFPETHDLAGVVFQREFKVRSLPDGRIVFAAMDVHLPVTVSDMPQQLLLFALDPGRSPVVTRLIPRKSEGQVPDLIYAFEVSPDGRLVSLPGRAGSVEVLELATGEISSVVQPFNLPKEILMTPVWRSADELCCLGPPAKGGALPTVNLLRIRFPEVTVAQVLSADWPESVAPDFLEPQSTFSVREAATQDSH